MPTADLDLNDALSEPGPAMIEALAALASGRAPLDGAVVARLIELLAEPSKEISRRAAGALAHAVADARHRSKVEAALDDGDCLRRWGAAFALARGGVKSAAVANAAIAALALDDGDIRWAAAQIVCECVRLEDSLVERLEAALRTGNPAQCKMALYCLRDLGVKRAAVFVAALEHEDAGVRLAALSGTLRCEGIDLGQTRRLIACMENDADIGVRRAAAACLGRIDGAGEDVRSALERAREVSGDADFIRAATASIARLR